MSFSKILLAGAAIGALAAAPAMARTVAPSIHLISHGTVKAVPGKLHLKSNIHDPSTPNYTQTATFTGSLSTATAYKVKTILLGESWVDSSSCTQPTKQKWATVTKPTKGTLSYSSSTGMLSSGACPTTTFTFQDIDYTLKAKVKAGGADITDSLTSDLIAKKFLGYNLKLVANVDLTITP